MKRFRTLSRVPLLGLVLFALVLSGCGKRQTNVTKGNKDQVLHLGNGAEPSDLDPHTVSGVPEHVIIKALFEGLVMADPKDLKPEPGVAEKWEVSPDGKTYTFFLRDNALWSNGDPITSADFIRSYERILNPKMASPYATMLHVMVNAKEYNEGTLKEFSQVGVHALSDKKLQIQLRSPVAFFLGMLKHYSWFPVHTKTIDKHGKRYDKGNRWTRPENIVSNGPFVLKEWRTNEKIIVAKSEKYWDNNRVRLKEIHFYPIESEEAEELAFRAGQLHVTYGVPLSKVDGYRTTGSTLRLEPYYGTYFYRVNLDPKKNPNVALKDARVRRALSMALNRESLIKNVTRSVHTPAYSYVPPGPVGYLPKDKLKYDPEAARKLLVEAGFPGGKGVGKISIQTNVSDVHKPLAEAIQQMWKKELGIESEIVTQEWKVYMDAQRNLDYVLSRSAWIADYMDPNSFLEIFRTGNGNNSTGWSNAEYDKLIEESWAQNNAVARLESLKKAEALLLQEGPVIPIFFYVRDYLITSSVKGWSPNVLDDHPFKYVFLDEAAAADKLPVLGTTR